MLPVAGFDWDDGNHDKCQRHGVSIVEIETLFRGYPITGYPPMPCFICRRYVSSPFLSIFELDRASRFPL